MLRGEADVDKLLSLFLFNLIEAPSDVIGRAGPEEV
jgi:hypothetical protein